MPRPRGRLPIRVVLFGVDAGGEESLELAARLVDHAERRIARVRQRRCGLDELLQQRVE